MKKYAIVGDSSPSDNDQLNKMPTNHHTERAGSEGNTEATMALMLILIAEIGFGKRRKAFSGKFDLELASCTVELASQRAEMNRLQNEFAEFRHFMDGTVAPTAVTQRLPKRLNQQEQRQSEDAD